MKIAVYGATGSVGIQTLDVVRKNKDRLETVFLSANSNTDKLAELCAEFLPPYIGLTGDGLTDAQKSAFEARLNRENPRYRPVFLYGKSECAEFLSGASEIGLAVIAVSGLNGLLPSYTALKNNIPIALANKETLVAGGDLIIAEAKKNALPIYPVDSEHSAIRECLVGNDIKNVDRLILTASGGPFRTFSAKELKHVTLSDALNHPTWKMGKKVTVDSATMMNKGLEIIEAVRLFGIPEERIDVVVHPESIVHSMVEYSDRTVMAMMSVPDMRIPISRAFGVGDRLTSGAERLSLTRLGKLTFFEPDAKKFPCLSLAREAIRAGGILPTVLNAANERAVEEFSDGRIGFTEIPVIVECAMQGIKNFEPKSIEEIIEVDKRIRLKG
ncbi:MAG: 1-deoxy-D-xylulose-5-phosphate reductoisomerase [Clostridiales bacterium]|jgi:1-deoxy-D-xylulose-5-phosphate reductoisomerase|nr:1-deoxy-D-xylulose-5-phosphate reductoisomerase [Clostridiales bacterium]